MRSRSWRLVQAWSQAKSWSWTVGGPYRARLATYAEETVKSLEPPVIRSSVIPSDGGSCFAFGVSSCRPCVYRNRDDGYPCWISWLGTHLADPVRKGL